MARLVGRAAAQKAAMASIKAMEKRFAANVETLVHEVDTYIKSKTPVHTGQAVRNMIWTRGAANGTVYDAIGSGDPGRTNSMALGAEPRRAANEDAAAQSLAAINFADPFGVFSLTNLSPDIGGLEAGIYPGTPLTPRSPQGMFGLAEGYFAVRIASKGILS